jgi:hypothetical protein
MHSEILKPVVILAAWTMVMWVWMYLTRIPAMSKVPGMDINNKIGGTGGDLEAVLPGKVQWIAHNYNHLHEAPTVFYAIALTLAMIGQGDNLNATIACAYVALRIAHSLVQVLWNRVMVRFVLFALSSIALMMLVTHAVISVFGGQLPH